MTDSISEEKQKQLSKFMCWSLRHEPEKAGLEMDDDGWVDSEELITSAQEQYEWVDTEAVADVVVNDDKGRYDIDVDSDLIRASYGHSDDLDLNITNTNATAPDTLYHAVDSSKTSEVLNDGLEDVELKESITDAMMSGQRRDVEVTVLTVETDNITIKKAEEDVYRTDEVPPENIEVSDAVIG